MIGWETPLAWLPLPADASQSVVDPRYRALASKKGMVECQHAWWWCGRGLLAAVDVMLSNACAERHAAQAARDAGWTVTVWQAWHGGAMAVTMIYHRIMTATNKG